jgi:hypothetical protein
MTPSMRRGLHAVIIAVALGAHVPYGFGEQAQTVPLLNPVSERGALGLFTRIVTARGAEIDPGRAGLHMIRPIEVSDTFSSTAPEIYVVVELKQSAFDYFRLTARFILEDPSGKQVGTLLHTDRAHFEFSDTGGYLLMRQPAGGFPVGSYRVEIHYGEEVNELSLMALVRFKVVS